MSVECCSRRIIQEKCRIYRLKHVFNSFRVVVAGRPVGEAGGVGGLNPSIFEQIYWQLHNTRQTPHLQYLIPGTDCDEIRQFPDHQTEFIHDIKQFTEDIEELAVRKVKILTESVESDNHPIIVATFCFLYWFPSATPNIFLYKSAHR